MKTNFDIIIIGGGPGGYVAAIRAAQLNMKVALVEAKHLGGICLNWGCIPTKALLRSAEVANIINHANDYGIEIPFAKDPKIKVNFQSVIDRSRKVAKKLSSGIEMLMKKNKIVVFDGFGKLLTKDKDNHRVEVQLNNSDMDHGKNKITLSSKFVVLATGARAKTIKGIEPDGKRIWTYKEAMNPNLDTPPKDLLIIGSGAIGMEFASFYNAMGTKVKVVEAADRILHNEDEDISNLALSAFSSQGISIATNAKVSGVTCDNKTKRVLATINNKEESFDAVLIAVGVIANTENIGIEKLNIKLDNGHIVTDRFGQTSEPGIYAIGDLTSAPWLAHKASHEGVIAIEYIAGLSPHTMDKDNIPGCTYTFPQIASIGLTESAAIEKFGQDKICIGRFPFIANGKAVALGETEGLIKTVFLKDTGELLGAHMIGTEVTELISSFAIAKQAELTHEQIIQTIFPHPTLSEMVHESTLDALDKAIHI